MLLMATFKHLVYTKHHIDCLLKSSVQSGEVGILISVL